MSWLKNILAVLKHWSAVVRYAHALDKPVEDDIFPMSAELDAAFAAVTMRNLYGPPAPPVPENIAWR